GRSHPLTSDALPLPSAFRPLPSKNWPNLCRLRGHECECEDVRCAQFILVAGGLYFRPPAAQPLAASNHVQNKNSLCPPQHPLAFSLQHLALRLNGPLDHALELWFAAPDEFSQFVPALHMCLLRKNGHSLREFFASFFDRFAPGAPKFFKA